jgi:hypothetical protein
MTESHRSACMFSLAPGLVDARGKQGRVVEESMPVQKNTTAIDRILISHAPPPRTVLMPGQARTVLDESM